MDAMIITFTEPILTLVRDIYLPPPFGIENSQNLPPKSHKELTTLNLQLANILPTSTKNHKLPKCISFRPLNASPWRTD